MARQGEARFVRAGDPALFSCPPSLMPLSLGSISARYYSCVKYKCGSSLLGLLSRHVSIPSGSGPTLSYDAVKAGAVTLRLCFLLKTFGSERQFGGFRFEGLLIQKEKFWFRIDFWCKATTTQFCTKSFGFASKALLLWATEILHLKGVLHLKSEAKKGGGRRNEEKNPPPRASSDSILAQEKGGSLS